MKVDVRRGLPSDAEFLAEAMLSASRAHLRLGVWDLLIGGSEAGRLEYLRHVIIAEALSLCHYSSFLVAEADGRPAAALSSFDPLTAGWPVAAEAMSNVQGELGWTEADRTASYQRAAPVWACFLPDIGADWGIEHVATRPAHRGRGLATLLVDRALEEAREQGRRLVQITTYLGNNSALRAYEKCGFRVSDEKRCSEMEGLLGTSGFVRLVRDV